MIVYSAGVLKLYDAYFVFKVDVDTLLETNVEDLSKITTTTFTEFDHLRNGMDDFGKDKIDKGIIAGDNLIKQNVREIKKLQDVAKYANINKDQCNKAIEESEQLPTVIKQNLDACVRTLRNTGRTFVNAGITHLEELIASVNNIKVKITECKKNGYARNCALIIYAFTSKQIFTVHEMRVEKSKIVLAGDAEIDRCMFDGLQQIKTVISTAVQCMLN